MQLGPAAQMSHINDLQLTCVCLWSPAPLRPPQLRKHSPPHVTVPGRRGLVPGRRGLVPGDQREEADSPWTEPILLLVA